MNVRWSIALLVLAVAAPAGAETLVERGRYLVEGIGACGNCHTPKGPSGDLPDRRFAGGFEVTDSVGTWVTPNITPDRETGIGRWSDAELVRAIRDGKHRDGHALGPPMPFAQYRRLSDRDVQAMVAYLRTLPPVRNAVPRSRYTIPLPASYGPPVTSVPEPSRRDPVKYGAYLAGPVAHCVECHTPLTADGRLDETRPFAGGVPFVGPGGTVYSSNLTPDPETGLGAWTDAEVTRAVVNGLKRGGGMLRPPMPWPYYAGRVSEADARAIVAYLRTLPPIVNQVPPPRPPAPR